MCLYTSDEFTGMQKECDEGKLEWIPKEKLEYLYGTGNVYSTFKEMYASYKDSAETLKMKYLSGVRVGEAKRREETLCRNRYDHQ